MATCNMLKYYSTAITFSEIPDEITLCIEITSCPHRCVNCHSPWLREDIGEPLDESSLLGLIKKNPDITCVCFMGGDSSHEYICYLAKIMRLNTPKIKTAMYSGDDEIDPTLFKVLDYYKVGSYQEDKGPLNKETTNQKLFFVSREDGSYTDITYKFWHKI